MPLFAHDMIHISHVKCKLVTLHRAINILSTFYNTPSLTFIKRNLFYGLSKMWKIPCVIILAKLEIKVFDQLLLHFIYLTLHCNRVCTYFVLGQ